MPRIWEAASHKLCQLAGVISFTQKCGDYVVFDGMQAQRFDELDIYRRGGKLPILACSFSDI